MHVFVAVALCYSTVILIRSQESVDENEKFYIWISVLFDLFVCFVTFKKLTEKRLKIIETKYNEVQNREMLKKTSSSLGSIEKFVERIGIL